MTKNMYGDSVKQLNIVIGCNFDCIYCKRSFQAQMKRQKHNCKYINEELGESKCYLYEPHFHYERLFDSLPRTKGDEFIWINSSSDIYFAEELWINIILERIKKLKSKTFFFQTKEPSCLKKYNWPENVILGITLETNRDEGYELISKASNPRKRYNEFYNLDHKRKRLTIEPVLDFDVKDFVLMIKLLDPEIIYFGFDTKKTPGITPPSIEKTVKFLSKLNTLFHERLKLKYIPEEYKKELIKIDWL